MARAILIASLTEMPSEDGREIGALAGQADWLEVRADLVGDLEAEWLRERFPGKLLYTLRSKAEWGVFEGSREKRRRRILEKSVGYDLVDLEADRDCAPEVLDQIPAERRLVSWHGPATDERGLLARFGHLKETRAAIYKLVPRAANAGEELAPLNLLASEKRHDLVAFAGGETGFWTRLVAPRLGAPIVYGSATEVAAAPGQPSIAKLRDDYGLPELPAVRWLFGVVGDPALGSLSPRIHNACYRALGLPALFVPFETPEFGDFWLEIVDTIEGGALERLGLKLGGLAVTTPHKEVAFAVAGATSPLATRLEAVNTLTPRDGVWEGESTDGLGVTEALRARGFEPKGKRAVVVGAGGAGRAAALALALAGAAVTLANRTEAKGKAAAKNLGLSFTPLADLDVGAFDLVVHATPLGRREDDPLPIRVEALAPGAALLDLKYGAQPTRLVAEAKARGLLAIDGREVLLRQAVPQFRLMTGRAMPVEVAARALGIEAGIQAEPK